MHSKLTKRAIAGRFSVAVLAAVVALVSYVAPAVAHASSGGYQFERLVVAVPASVTPSQVLHVTFYYRLNRALPDAPKGRFEGEEEDGPRIDDAYLLLDHGSYMEGVAEVVGKSDRHCYTESIEVPISRADRQRFRVGALATVSLFVHRHYVRTARTRIKRLLPAERSIGRDGTPVVNESQPYELPLGM